MLFTSTLFLYCHINSNCVHTNTHVPQTLFTQIQDDPTTLQSSVFIKTQYETCLILCTIRCPCPPFFILWISQKKIQIYSQINTTICTQPELSKYAPMYPSYNLYTNETRTAPTSPTWLETLQLDKQSSQHYPPPNAYGRTNYMLLHLT